LSSDDKKLLQEPSEQCHGSFEKVIQLIDTEKEFEFKDHRTDIYSASNKLLHNIILSRLMGKIYGF